MNDKSLSSSAFKLKESLDKRQNKLNHDKSDDTIQYYSLRDQR